MRLSARACFLALAGLGTLYLPLVLAATLEVHVQALDGRPLPGAVVMVHALGSAGHGNPPVQAIMDQVNLAFTPDLLVIPVGSTVRFPNSDSVSHQIYSFSRARPFQLPLYHGAPYPPVSFDQPGVVVLGCNIHDSMLAYIVVTDASFFGRSDAKGIWSAATVPPGRYRISMWHPRLRDSKEVEQEFTVADVPLAEFTLKIPKPLKPAALQAHPHSWDAY